MKPRHVLDILRLQGINVDCELPLELSYAEEHRISRCDGHFAELIVNDQRAFENKRVQLYSEVEESHKHDKIAKQEGWDLPLFEEFTCSTCNAVMHCLFAYDLYNTNGDCLAEK